MKKTNESVDYSELQKIVKIYGQLTEAKRNVWIGSGNLLLASQQMEETSKKEPLDTI